MIYQKNNLKIIRPLLNMHRFEMRQFVRFWQLPIYSDQSNQNTNYLRNKIRKQLMPILRIFFNPHIDTVLSNFVNIRKNEQRYFQNIVNSLLRSEPEQDHPYFLFFLESKRETCQLKFCISTETLNGLSRNQILIFWLIINISVIRKFPNYPSIFQKQILKTTLKTFNQVDSAFINLHSYRLLTNENPFGKKKGNSNKNVTHIPKPHISNLSHLSWIEIDKISKKQYFPYNNKEISTEVANPKGKHSEGDNTKPYGSGVSPERKRKGLLDIADKEKNASLISRALEGGINFRSTSGDLLAIQSNTVSKTGLSDFTYIYEKKLTQIFVLKFLKRFFFFEEKKILLVGLNNLIKKYKNL